MILVGEFRALANAAYVVVGLAEVAGFRHQVVRAVTLVRDAEYEDAWRRGQSLTWEETMIAALEMAQNEGDTSALDPGDRSTEMSLSVTA